MNTKDNLGNRMKGYEFASRYYLPERMPIIVRIDGAHFHTYTKGCKKPFDVDLAQAFWDTCKYLTQNIMGCKLAYHQSDEISLLITNYDKLTTQSWFNNNLQKIASVAASMATACFNDIMRANDPEKALATFDARAFVLPQDEVVNYFIWRQQDATKNSVSMVAQANFSHKVLQGLNGKEMQDKLMLEKGLNWNDLPVWQKRGVCIKKELYEKNGALRSNWAVDQETPIFTQDRNYIEQFIFLKGEKYA